MNQTKKPSRAGANSSKQNATKSKKQSGGGSIQSVIKKSIYGGISRSAVSSAGKKNVQISGAEKLSIAARQPPVLDDQGNDVTPLPLLLVDPNTLRKGQSKLLAESVGTPSELMSQASIYQTGGGMASTFGGGPFTRSIFSASQSEKSNESMVDPEMHETSTEIPSAWAEIRHKREVIDEKLTENDLDKIVDINLSETETLWLIDMPGICISNDAEEAQRIKEKNAKYVETLQRKALQADIGAGFDIPLEILTKSRAGNDRYAERGMNTFNFAPKYKSVQTTKIQYVESGVNATSWDMYDTYKALEDNEKAKKKREEDEEEDFMDKLTNSTTTTQTDGEKQDEEKSTTALDKKSDSPSSIGDVSTEKAQGDVSTEKAQGSSPKKITIVATPTSESQATVMSSIFGDSNQGSVAGKIPLSTEPEENKAEIVLNSDELKKSLFIMERVINMNTFQPKQASYRGFEVIKDALQNNALQPKESLEESVSQKSFPVATSVIQIDLGPNLDRLWSYQCPLTEGHNASCIAWNKSNPDLLAVGYGQYEFTNQKSGLLCCWSLKNPEYPERVFKTSAGVMSLDFSRAHPNLLAAGLHDGTIAIYNVRSTTDECILDSLKDLRPHADYYDEDESQGKHMGPVWQLKWIEKERGSGEEKIEVLVSISTDGRVVQWSIRKGFESYDLMKLKRMPAKVGGKQKKTEAFISRFAGGLCFDFCTTDSNIYLAGTEEGHIHKCSCSYNEQYLDTYSGHTGPVYAIHWSPFVPDIFLSCSADWTIKLWHQDKLKPVLSFHSSTKSVPDISWSPRSSTVFSCVNEGAVEIWDLSQSTLDPIIVCNPPFPNIRLSSVNFARNSDCVLVGDSEGNVSVYQLKGMAKELTDHNMQAERLDKLVKTTIQNQLEKKMDAEPELEEQQPRPDSI